MPQDQAEQKKDDKIFDNSLSALFPTGSMEGSSASAQNLQLLHCAVQLAGGKQDEIQDYLERMESRKVTYSVHKYIASAKLGVPCSNRPTEIAH